MWTASPNLAVSFKYGIRLWRPGCLALAPERYVALDPPTLQNPVPERRRKKKLLVRFVRAEVGHASRYERHNPAVLISRHIIPIRIS
jgi:hypothetical protein